MRRNRGGIYKRLAGVEFCQQERRDREFRALTHVLVTSGALTPEQDQRLLQLFYAEYDAGISVITSIYKLPEPFRSSLFEVLKAKVKADDKSR